MTSLVSKKCLPCEGGVAALTVAQAQELLVEIPGWQLDSQAKSLYQDMLFKNFHQVMAFANAVAWIAHQENHHPELHIGFQHCLVRYSTHAIDGLSENDFICAAKVNALLKN